jgi:hypothetical protein
MVVVLAFCCADLLAQGRVASVVCTINLLLSLSLCSAMCLLSGMGTEVQCVCPVVTNE